MHLPKCQKCKESGKDVVAVWDGITTRSRRGEFLCDACSKLYGINMERLLWVERTLTEQNAPTKPEMKPVSGRNQERRMR